ncbi:ras-interacting protein RIP3-like [Rhagoletis pomonella]|uniref:ras-interacting protein RIP3-like n=1 Tax=Rhagoletis pomonella TaxID=28610 RepID=UPI0017825748|nr:ras-interacting protein RIP3-like [Rhagoletis pomonella]
MNQAEICAQKQRERNERRLSVQHNNAYYFIRCQSDSESTKPNPSTTLEPPQDSSQRTCPPNLTSTTPMSWIEECASPVPYHISRPTLTSNSVSDNISPNIAAATTSTVTSLTTSNAPTTTTTNTPVPANCTAMSKNRPILAEQAQIGLSESTYTGNKG